MFVVHTGVDAVASNEDEILEVGHWVEGDDRGREERVASVSAVASRNGGVRGGRRSPGEER